VLRWQLTRAPERRRRPRGPIPRRANDGASLARTVERSELTWIGHASFALHEGERVALFDPHFGPRALLPRRWSAPGVPIGSIPPDAVALLSHNHYDHLDRWTLARLPKGIDWLVPLGLERFVRRYGFRSVRGLDWGEEADAGGWRFTFLPAQHWSRRLSQADNTTLWGSWLVDTGRTRLLFVGDSAYFAGFAAIGKRYAPLDAAILPIGAYEPRWFMAPAHMDPAESLVAFHDLGARRMVASHWGVFELADDPVDEPPRRLARVLATRDEAGTARSVAVPAVGETVAL